MQRVKDKKLGCVKWKNLFCPKICEKLEDNKDLSSFCHITWNEEEGYEVQYHKDIFVVDVIGRKCTCRSWDLTGIPCPHATCVILFRNEVVEDYVADVYKKELYHKCYNYVVPVIPGDTLWPVTNMKDIDLPFSRKLPGRPRKNRIKEDGESNSTKLSRKGRKMICQVCFKLGHNSRKCLAKQKQNVSVFNPKPLPIFYVD
ncbi:hypothetical protein REPUB_Repub03eG0109500 [Reevesia pubescens]